jgi:hypothetical protein
LNISLRHKNDLSGRAVGYIWEVTKAVIFFSRPLPAFWVWGLFLLGAATAWGVDFAPLQVGNTWKYLYGTSTSSTSVNLTEEGNSYEMYTWLTVVSREYVDGDTVTTVLDRDSVFAQTSYHDNVYSYAPDYVTLDTMRIHERNGEITQGNIYFTSHEGTVYGRTTINGLSRVVCKQGTAIYADGIGFVDNSSGGWTMAWAFNTTHSLLEFNGTPLSGIKASIVGVEKANAMPPNPAGRELHVPGAVRGTTRDIRGRSMITEPPHRDTR